MVDKTNDNVELHNFTVELVNKLFDEGLIDDKENIPDDIRELIIEAVKVSSKKNKDNEIK